TMAARKLLAPSSDRRTFLKRIALVTAGTSVASLASTPSVSVAQTTPYGNCPGPRAPMKEVEGKTAFITGGSSGIGLGIARAFVDAGMKVAIGYRTHGHLDEAMQVLEHARDRVHAISV